jgi:prohibitin 2
MMQVYEEGTHLMIPWFERPIIYDVRARPSQITSTSGSRDLQMVSPASLNGQLLTRPHHRAIHCNTLQINIL